MAIKPSEQMAIVATIDPDAYGADTYVSDWIDIGKFKGGLMAVEHLALEALTRAAGVPENQRAGDED